MKLYEYVHAVQEIERPIRVFRRSERQKRKDYKNRNKVCMMLTPGLDGAPYVEVEVLKDHYRPTDDSWERSQSAWSYNVDCVGAHESLGMIYDSRDSEQWMKEAGVTLFQKFTIEFRLHSTYDSYNGDYDVDVDCNIIWRGVPDTHALEEVRARGGFLAALEGRLAALGGAVPAEGGAVR